MADNQTNSDRPADEDSQRLLTEFPYPTYEQWKTEVEKQLKGASFDRKMLTDTYEGITLQPIYTGEDTAKIPQRNSLPGFSPYLRGANAAGDTVKPWQIAQEISYPTPEQFNDALRFDLERGQTAVNMPLDRLTRSGRDADSANTENIGSGGVSISSVDDLKAALKGVDLQKIPLYVQAGFSSLPFLTLLISYLSADGHSTAELHGSVTADPLGQLAADGSLPISLDQAYGEMAAVTSWSLKNAPALRTISANDLTSHESGGSAVEDLGFALAAAVEYLRAMETRGLDINDTASHIQFSFTAGPHFFTEVAKLRAARMLWADIMKATGTGNSASKMAIHVRTSARNATRFDPYVNMLRTTGEAFSGVIGGCDSLHVGCFDQAVRPPEEFSRRIARNTQLILRHESHLDRVIDPAGGSWYIESLTDQLAREAWDFFRDIESKGGLFKALQTSFVQERIAATAAKRKKAVCKRKDVIIGTNKFPNVDEKPLEIHNSDRKAIAEERLACIADLKSAATHKSALDTLSQLKSSESLTLDSIELLVKAAADGATLGDISEALRPEGAGPQTTSVAPYRDADPFERIRLACDAWRQKHHSAPTVYVTSVGQYAKLKPRIDFAVEFFQVSGFDVTADRGHGSTDDAAKAALDANRPVVVLCGADDGYPGIIPQFTRAVKAAIPDATIVVAGNPAEQAEQYRKAGVDDFIFVGADACDILERICKKLGVMS